MDDIKLTCKNYIKGQICYSCGKPLCENYKCKEQRYCKISKTLDHIPPKGLFKQNKGYPNIISNPEKQKITVPCCRECNNLYSKDEENFLIYITMIAAAKGSKIAEYALKNRYRTLDKNKLLARNYINNIKGKVDITTKSGIYIEPGVIFGINKNKEIESIQKILKKMVKGFYYQLTNKYLEKEVHCCYDNVFYKINMINACFEKDSIPEQIKPLLNETKKGNKILISEKDHNKKIVFYNKEIQSDIFSYSFINFENKNCIAFVFKFYDNLEFILAT